MCVVQIHYAKHTVKVFCKVFKKNSRKLKIICRCFCTFSELLKIRASAIKNTSTLKRKPFFSYINCISHLMSLNHNLKDNLVHSDTGKILSTRCWPYSPVNRFYFCCDPCAQCPNSSDTKFYVFFNT